MTTSTRLTICFEGPAIYVTYTVTSLLKGPLLALYNFLNLSHIPTDGSHEMNTSSLRAINLTLT